MDLKQYARNVRDIPAVGSAIRFPFASLRKLGVPVPERVFRHLGPFRGDFDVRCPGGRKFRMRAYGDMIENYVFWEGVYGWEVECIAPWIALCRTSRTIFDIGANTGLYSLIAACESPGAQIHAFEPLARTLACLRANCALNPALAINTHPEAIGAAPGEAEICDPGGNAPYSASLNASWTHLGGIKARQRVRVVSTDSAVADLGLSGLDLIKLDVEGFEDFVLAGMQETVRTMRPAIMLEFVEERAAVIEQLERICAQDYHFYHLFEEGLRRASRIEKAPKGFNVLLLPAERSTAELRVLTV